MPPNKKKLVIETSPRKALTPPLTSPVEAIIISQFQQSDEKLDDDDIEEAAQNKIKQALTETSVDRASEMIRWGNSSGLSTLEKFDEMEVWKGNVKKLQVRIDSAKHLVGSVKDLKAEEKCQKNEIQVMKSELQVLKLINDSYFNIRSRFLSVFL